LPRISADDTTLLTDQSSQFRVQRLGCGLLFAKSAS
jgi:hypothetical protein